MKAWVIQRKGDGKFYDGTGKDEVWRKDFTQKVSVFTDRQCAKDLMEESQYRADERIFTGCKLVAVNITVAMA